MEEQNVQRNDLRSRGEYNENFQSFESFFFCDATQDLERKRGGLIDSILKFCWKRCYLQASKAVMSRRFQWLNTTN